MPCCSPRPSPDAPSASPRASPAPSPPEASPHDVASQPAHAGASQSYFLASPAGVADSCCRHCSPPPLTSLRVMPALPGYSTRLPSLSRHNPKQLIDLMGT